MKFVRPTESFARRGIGKSAGYARQADGLAAPYVQFLGKGSGRPEYEDTLEIQAAVAGLTDDQLRELVQLELGFRAEVLDETVALDRGRAFIRKCIEQNRHKTGGRAKAQAA